TSRMTDTAFGTVIVISTTGMPPAQIASTARVASSTDAARTTGMIPTSSILRITSSIVISVRRPNSEVLSLDAGGSRFHGFYNFRQRCHGRVAGRGHRQGPVRCAAFDRPLRILTGQESVNQTGSEGIASTYAIVDFKIFPHGSLMKAAIAVAQGSPIV